MPTIRVDDDTYNKLKALKLPTPDRDSFDECIDMLLGAYQATVPVTPKPVPLPPPPPPPPATGNIPINVAMLIAKDFQPGGPRFYAGPGVLAGILHQQVTNIRKWYERELSLTFDINFKTIPSAKTSAELGANADGEGFNETLYWGELGKVFDLSGPHRTWCVGTGSMHWYGGRYDVAADKGGAFWGDDTFTLLVANNWTNPLPPETGGGHETLHGMGLYDVKGGMWDLHTDYKSYPEVLSDKWRNRIKDVSRKFLRPL